MLIDFLLNPVASLANTLNREKGLEAKLSASNKALEEAKTCLAYNSIIFSSQSRTQQLIVRYFVRYCTNITMKYGISLDTVRY
jgi:ABC-type Fe3+-citrate transport system substrate-binding protein